MSHKVDLCPQFINGRKYKIQFKFLVPFGYAPKMRTGMIPEPYSELRPVFTNPDPDAGFYGKTKGKFF